MKIVMVGSGYVGLVSGACLAEIGHDVTCVDIDKDKISKLQDGIPPIYEPGLDKLIQQNQLHGRLFFSSDLKQSLNQAEVAFIAVGTPPGESGEADLKYVEAVATEIGQSMTADLLVMVKSTVPVGSCQKVEDIITQELSKRKSTHQATVASNPEFLKEGTAIGDFMQPDRIVVGLKGKHGEKEVQNLYRPFTLDDPGKLLIVERKSSEMIKYTANAMLATRISFMNDLSGLCEKLGVDISQVRRGIGADPRIGKKFLYAGPGFGGSCFPKDVRALLKTSEACGHQLRILEGVMEVNERQKKAVARKIKDHFGDLHGRRLAIWGLSFKPGTDDTREAPALSIIRDLTGWGAEVVAHDPQATESFKKEIGELAGLSYVDRAYDALKGADGLVLLTEWREYRWPNWQMVRNLLKGHNLFDLRNQYEAETLKEAGFHYECVGRPDSRTDSLLTL
ncbi:MAG: UDP-glucose/GDP-mannose dehydrogenase family protein [Deltaproteobacteria bacterium]|nr:UDP-glucose/GDP-mannose dehydrogenase family protein [Deltaproteobacteria bacterium]